MNDLDSWLCVIALGLTTVVTRGFFLYPERDLPLPDWMHRALKYAPLAALIAVIVPEAAWTPQGLFDTWRSARLWAAVTAALYFAARRGVFGSLLSSTAIYLALRLGLGW